MALATSDDDATFLYIRLVRQECSEAAVAIEQIQRRFGAQAALRAALILILLKNEVERSPGSPDVGLFSYVLEAYPEALPWFEVAVTLCFERWGLQPIDPQLWAQWQQALGSQSEALQDPFVSFLQRLHQHCPRTAVTLEQLYQNHGYTAGSYGTTALIWLEARVALFGDHILLELTEAEIAKFTFVEQMHGDPAALHQFNDLLVCYRVECEAESHAAP